MRRLLPAGITAPQNSASIAPPPVPDITRPSTLQSRAAATADAFGME
jgi:hypothetical protein